VGISLYAAFIWWLLESLFSSPNMAPMFEEILAGIVMVLTIREQVCFLEEERYEMLN
jgi:hypothetical protein